MGVSLRLLLTSKKTSESSSAGSISEPLSLAENLLQQLQLHNEREEVNKAAQYIVDELSKVGETTAEQVPEEDTIGQRKGKEKKMPEKKKRALPGKFAKEEEGKPSWAAKKGKLPFGAKKGKAKVADTEEPPAAEGPSAAEEPLAAVASEVVEQVSQDVSVVEQPPVEAEVSEKPQGKKKHDIIKKKKALAGKFADEEEHEFKAKKGKKDKKHGKDHAAGKTASEETVAAVVDEGEQSVEAVSVPAEVAAESTPVAEATEETQDKKKRDIVKKKKALAGKFADEEEHTFKSKKGKKHKEPAAAPAAKQEPVAAQEPAVPEAAEEIPLEPVAAEPEVTEQSEEKKKKDIIKKKKALAGKFVGEQEK